MKARIHVYLKPGVLDPQGAAVAGALKNLGFDEVENARQGKLIELEKKWGIKPTEYLKKENERFSDWIK